jgi:UDP-glucose 4-epimerase
MRYLITGGAGFIGSHLAEALVVRGEQVTVLDNLSTGRFANIEGLQARPGFKYVWGDIQHEPLVEELVRDCDVVLHLAAAVGVRLVVEQPVFTIQCNVRGTENVLKYAARYWRKTLITSTSEVYGKIVSESCSEDDDSILGATTKSRWAYAASKCVDEFLALAYHNEMSLPVILVRLFNTVGPRQTGRYGMVLPRFAAQALAGKPITVYGDGTQVRCFAHVSDVVGAIIGLLQCPAAVGQVINIGSAEEITINGLAAMVKDVTGSDSKITHVRFEDVYTSGFEDIDRRKPNLAKIGKLIGYKSRYTLRQTVESVVEFARAHGDREGARPV